MGPLILKVCANHCDGVAIAASRPMLRCTDTVTVVHLLGNPLLD